jgi:FlaA1/EpsC-like NDP-sugar epimerase
MRNRHFLLLDSLAATLAALLAFTIRFEGFSWMSGFGRMAVCFVVIVVPLKLAAFFASGLYSRLWRYASIADLEVLLGASILNGLISGAVGLVVMPSARLVTPDLVRIPLGVLVIDALLTAFAISISRLLLRIIVRRNRTRLRAANDPVTANAPRGERRVLIAGAGDAGGMAAKELLDNPQLGLLPVGFVDDDRHKHGHHLHGLRVLGSISDIDSIVRRLAIDEVITALPTARGNVVREIMQRSAAAGARNRTVPGLYEILSGAKAVSALRPIQIEDLLRREPIATNLNEVASLATGRVVMVTGAGGSIGSELCRQIARLAPDRLVVVGRGENSIFELVEELRVAYPDVPVYPAIVDVRDMVRLRAVFDATNPYTVFHAAAHKHVPLMEMSVDEAILNNVLGTRNVAELCVRYDVERLVLVSTDKAVRPTSIMGATKRIAEVTLYSAAARSGKPYVSVRFGNVLGSRGSVVPTFLRQIAAGGPITITHREMRRYFMTIPEAVQLVLQAGALGNGGEVFVLDMGDPVRIADLAEDLIRLSGLTVGSDVEIVFTGMRPGEKLYEELFFGPDDATPTSHPKILQARDGNPSQELDWLIDNLINAALLREPENDLRRMIQALVPGYSHPSLRDSDNSRVIRRAPEDNLSVSVQDVVAD